MGLDEVIEKSMPEKWTSVLRGFNLVSFLADETEGGLDRREVETKGMLCEIGSSRGIARGRSIGLRRGTRPRSW